MDIAFWAALWRSPPHSVLGVVMMVMETVTRQSSKEEPTSLGDLRGVVKGGGQGAWALA